MVDLLQDGVVGQEYNINQKFLDVLEEDVVLLAAKCPWEDCA